jgi:hypothetical protein
MKALTLSKAWQKLRMQWTLIFRMVWMGLPYFVDSSVYDGVLDYKMEFWATWTRLGWDFDWSERVDFLHAHYL